MLGQGLGLKVGRLCGAGILDITGKPIGEFDGIFHNKKLFVEDKSAEGLFNFINPKTGKPWQSVEDWALKQIYKKTVRRIEALRLGVSTRPRLTNGLAPSINDIKGFRKLEFQILESNIDLQNAVLEQIEKLKNEFPNWEFTVKFGK